MTIEDSIMKTARMYNGAIRTKRQKSMRHFFMGKIVMYQEVSGKHIAFITDTDGKIKEVKFGEESRSVE